LTVEHKLEGNFFIKIDVDGYDYFVARGAVNSLKDSVLLVELSPGQLKQQNEDAHEFIAFLHEIGFSNYVLYDNGGYLIQYGSLAERKSLDQLIDYALLSRRMHFDIVLFTEKNTSYYSEFVTSEKDFLHEFQNT
jgi:hypothetical protein